MECVSGIELRKLLNKHEGLTESFAKKIFKSLLIGVSHMHKKNFIHRDLKLENIFAKFEGKIHTEDQFTGVKIIDLGLGFRMQNPKVSTNGMVGTAC